VARPSGLRLFRLANPFVRLFLRSPLHGLLSGSLLLLTYDDPRDGRARTIPVLYADAGGAWLVLAARPASKRWWRAFRRGGPATLRLAGCELAARGTLLGPGEAPAALRSYLRRFPRAARTVGVTANAPDEAFAAAAGTVAIVAFGPLDAL